MSRRLALCLLFLSLALGAAPLAETSPDPWDAKRFEGLALRNIGPALMSGRIADIAIHPSDPSLWYVAVGSGGVFKTTNAGTTWTPLFDAEDSYSIGCVALDPQNPHVVWVGTGENVGGRHVGFGDGVYRSEDGGATWTHMGLGDTEHIAKILIHPEDSKVVWVAAEGPLWTKGGERGLYRSRNGGETWERVLGDDGWTGVTDVEIDPRDPDRLYAATWQRHRSVAAYVGGGPGSGVHASSDGGRSWTRLETGLPEGNLGKIGLAISPQRPDVLYAAIELNRRTGGVWRSNDRGASWEKRSDAVSGATGPHYYQELVASPHAFDRIYLLDVRVQVSDDGGANFRKLAELHKHSDNHALAFRADDPEYLLIGTDGGVYESHDLAKSWRFLANLPVTQFYKVAVDDAEPFYTIYGGTQDNNTQGGPSRTDNVHGIRNADWFVTLFGDGHQPATEPGNPAVMYSQWQQGNLVRVDRTTGEVVYIQPQPEAGASAERFNWDAPILVSPHAKTRLYFGSQRLWRSEDRGDSWVAISPDLTRDQDRMLLPLMGRQWSWDAPWDMSAMSQFNTITSIAESPLAEGLLYVGTDDGMLQISEDGGAHWRAVEVGSLPGVPPTAYVNDIKADLFDADTLYVALDAHKDGDMRPLLYKSDDRGKGWERIAGDLPERHLVWRVVQDHVRPELLFAGTEFGVFFTVDGGKHWIELQGGVPTIPFRDLVIQRRENDLVGASFGRGIFVLDDYTPLRALSTQTLKREGALFPPRDALWYIEREVLGGGSRAAQGAGHYVAPNPPFGAVFTYHLGKSVTTRTERRQEAEKAQIERGEDTPRPPWDQLAEELAEPAPAILLTVRDAEGKVVRRVEGPVEAGFHRVAWGLRRAPTRAIKEKPEPWQRAAGRGALVAPGRYSVTLDKRQDGKVSRLDGPVEFDVVPLRRGAIEGAAPAEAVAFAERFAAAERQFSAVKQALAEAKAKVTRFEAALGASTAEPGELDHALDAVRRDLLAIEAALTGAPAKRAVAEPRPHAVSRRIRAVRTGVSRSTYGPTPNLVGTLEIAESSLATLGERLRVVLEERLPALEKELNEADAPYAGGSAAFGK